MVNCSTGDVSDSDDIGVRGAHFSNVRHTGDVDAKMVAAAQQLLGGIIERYESVAEGYRKLKAFHLDEAMFRSLVVQPAIGVHPAKRRAANTKARPLRHAVVERWERRQVRLASLWRSGAGHTGDDSAWEAYNGAVEAIDHDSELWPTRSDAHRTWSLLDGELRAAKERVFGKLMKAASTRG